MGKDMIYIILALFFGAFLATGCQPIEEEEETSTEVECGTDEVALEVACQIIEESVWRQLACYCEASCEGPSGHRSLCDDVEKQRGRLADCQAPFDVYMCIESICNSQCEDEWTQTVSTCADLMAY